MGKKHRIKLCISDIEEERIDPNFKESLYRRRIHKFTEMFIYNNDNCSSNNKKKHQDFILNTTDTSLSSENDINSSLNYEKLNNKHNDLLNRYKYLYIKHHLEDHNHHQIENIYHENNKDDKRHFTNNSNNIDNAISIRKKHIIMPKIKNHSMDLLDYKDIIVKYKYRIILKNTKKQVENNIQIIWEWILDNMDCFAFDMKNIIYTILEILFEIKNANIYNIKMGLCQNIIKIIDTLEKKLLHNHNDSIIDVSNHPYDNNNNANSTNNTDIHDPDHENNNANASNTFTSTKNINTTMTNTNTNTNTYEINNTIPSIKNSPEHNNTNNKQFSNIHAYIQNLKVTSAFSSYSNESKANNLDSNDKIKAVITHEHIKKLLLKIRYSLSTLGHLYQYHHGIMSRWAISSSSSSSSSTTSLDKSLLKNKNTKYAKTRLKNINKYCDKFHYLKLKSTFIIKKMEELEDIIHKDQSNLFIKWERDYRHFWLSKLNKWKIASTMLQCKICEREFKITDFESHSAFCRVLTENRNKITLLNNQISKICEKAFEHKKTLTTKSVMRRKKNRKAATRIESPNVQPENPIFDFNIETIKKSRPINKNQDSFEQLDNINDIENLIDNDKIFKNCSIDKLKRVKSEIKGDQIALNLYNTLEKEDNSSLDNLSSVTSNSGSEDSFQGHIKNCKVASKKLEPSEIVKQKVIYNINLMRQKSNLFKEIVSSKMMKSAVYPIRSNKPIDSPECEDLHGKNILISVRILDFIIKYGIKLQHREIVYQDSIEAKQEINHYLSDKETIIDLEAKNIAKQFYKKLEEKSALEASIIKQDKRNKIIPSLVNNQSIRSREYIRKNILSASMRVKRNSHSMGLKNEVKLSKHIKGMAQSDGPKKESKEDNTCIPMFIRSTSGQHSDKLEQSSFSYPGDTCYSSTISSKTEIAFRNDNSNYSLSIMNGSTTSTNNQETFSKYGTESDGNNCSSREESDNEVKKSHNNRAFQQSVLNSKVEKTIGADKIQKSPVVGIINAETTKKFPNKKNIVGISLFGLLAGKKNTNPIGTFKSPIAPTTALISNTKSNLFNIEKANVLYSSLAQGNSPEKDNNSPEKVNNSPEKVNISLNTAGSTLIYDIPMPFYNKGNEKNGKINSENPSPLNSPSKKSTLSSKDLISNMVPIIFPTNNILRNKDELTNSPNLKLKLSPFYDLSSNKAIIDPNPGSKFKLFGQNSNKIDHRKIYDSIGTTKSINSSYESPTYLSVPDKVMNNLTLNHQKTQFITISNGMKFMPINRREETKKSISPNVTRIISPMSINLGIFKQDDANPIKSSRNPNENTCNQPLLFSSASDCKPSTLKLQYQKNQIMIESNQAYLSPNINHIGILQSRRNAQNDLKGVIRDNFGNKKKKIPLNALLSPSPEYQSRSGAPESHFNNHHPKENKAYSEDVINKNNLTDKIHEDSIQCTIHGVVADQSPNTTSKLMNQDTEIKCLKNLKNRSNSFNNPSKTKKMEKILNLNRKFLQMDDNIQKCESWLKSNKNSTSKICDKINDQHEDFQLNKQFEKLDNSINYNKEDNSTKQQDKEQQIVNKGFSDINISPCLKGYYSDSEAKNFAKSKKKSCEIGFIDFEFLKPIGKGAFGTVWLVKKKATGDIYAMKIIDCSNQKDLQNYLKEREVFSVLNGEFVVKAVWSFISNHYLCFVMEYMIGGDFGSILEKYSCLYEDMARFYLAEIVLALESLHKIGIIHRDLKPENILLDSKGHIKLTDFGLSDCKVAMVNKTQNDLLIAKRNQKITKFFTKESKSPSNLERKIEFFQGDSKLAEKKAPQLLSDSPKIRSPIKESLDKDSSSSSNEKKDLNTSNKKIRIIGTPDYIAPEIIKGQKYDEFIDLWSLGVLLYEFICGIPPFNDSTVPDIFDNILNLRINWPEIGYGDDCISPEAYNLITKLLVLDPQQRLKIEEIKKHPFFKGIDWNNIRKQPAPLTPKFVSSTDTSNFTKSDGIEKKLPTIFLGPWKHSKNQAINAVDKDAFNLIRLDILHQLNEEQYRLYKARLENTKDDVFD